MPYNNFTCIKYPILKAKCILGVYICTFLSQWGILPWIFLKCAHKPRRRRKKKQFIFYLLSNIEYYNNNSNIQFIYFQYIENTLYQCIMSSCIISASIMLCYHCESHGIFFKITWTKKCYICNYHICKFMVNIK
jgi:hypothetical protein